MDVKTTPTIGKHRRDARSLLVQFICACAISDNRLWFLVRRWGYVIYNSLAWNACVGDVNLLWVVLIPSCISEAKRDKDECYKQRSLHVEALVPAVPVEFLSHEKRNSPKLIKPVTLVALQYCTRANVLNTFQEEPITAAPLIMPYRIR